MIAPADADLAAKFLAADSAGRKAVLKALAQSKDAVAFDKLVAALVFVCRKDMPKNHALLRELLHRYRLMSELNVNRKLQLETLLGL